MRVKIKYAVRLRTILEKGGKSLVATIYTSLIYALYQFLTLKHKIGVQNELIKIIIKMKIDMLGLHNECIQ